MRFILAGALVALTSCQYQAYADAAAALGLKSVQDAKDLEARVAIPVSYTHLTLPTNREV